VHERNFPIKSKDDFKSAFFDELLGMATRVRPAEDREWGIFVRDREARIERLMERMYAFVTEIRPAQVQTPPAKPAVTPVAARPAVNRVKT
jgi:hypothetical protein